MNKKVIIIVVGVIVLLLGIVLYVHFSSYVIDYNNNGSEKYVITISGNKIKTKHFEDCDQNKCKGKSQKKEFTYSKDNIVKLKEFLKNNFKSKRIELNHMEITERQKIVLNSLYANESAFEVAIEDCKYRMTYYDTDNIAYYIYYKNDNSILVKKTKHNDDYIVINITDTYQVDFSEKSTKLIKDYFVSEAKPHMEYTKGMISRSVLRKDEKPIINSILKKDEKYLDKYVKRIASIYSSLKCDVPTLYLYQDNTYETEDMTSRTYQYISGTYKYDINKLIKAFDKDKEGYYYLIDENGNKYGTKDIENKELNELLKQINITLRKCHDYESVED